MLQTPCLISFWSCYLAAVDIVGSSCGPVPKVPVLFFIFTNDIMQRKLGWMYDIYHRSLNIEIKMLHFNDWEWKCLKLIEVLLYFQNKLWRSVWAEITDSRIKIGQNQKYASKMYVCQTRCSVRICSNLNFWYLATYRHVM